MLTELCLCSTIEKDGGDVKALYRAQALEKLGRLDQAVLRSAEMCEPLEPKNKVFQEALS